MSDSAESLQQKKFEHKTVLKNEAVQELVAGRVEGQFVDVTFGGGGHSQFLLDSYPKAKVVGLDWDMEVIENVVPPLLERYKGRLQVLWGSFCQIYKLLKSVDINQVDGVLADFGTSQQQIFHKDGLSFASDSFLDMRMSKSHSKVTAHIVVNNFDEQEISQLFFDFGQERYARQIAREILHKRAEKPINTTLELAEVVTRVVKRCHKGKNQEKIHPATRVFQALRIFVNSELDNITNFLNSAVGLIRPGGRLVCISFHSLEDRLVKRFFQQKEQEGKLRIVSKKAIVAGEQELEDNPSSRSAKMRVAQLL